MVCLALKNLCLIFFLFWYWRSVSICLFSACQQFASVLIYTWAYPGSARGASGCLNSRFAIGELLRGATEFTLGGRGPFLFARCSASIWAIPPTRVHRQHISDSTVSSCNNKLPFCQTACTHNKREKAAPGTRGDTENSRVPRSLGCLQLFLRRCSFRAPTRFRSLPCQSHYACFIKDLWVLDHGNIDVLSERGECNTVLQLQDGVGKLFVWSKLVSYFLCGEKGKNLKSWWAKCRDKQMLFFFFFFFSMLRVQTLKFQLRTYAQRRWVKQALNLMSIVPARVGIVSTDGKWQHRVPNACGERFCSLTYSTSSGGLCFTTRERKKKRLQQL